MPLFRAHIQNAEPLDITAETAAEARKIAEGKNLGRIVKIKIVREAA